MGRVRFTVEQIIGKLREASVSDIIQVGFHIISW